MSNTYEIPTDNGVQTVTANSKQEAISNLSTGSKFTPNTPITSDSLKPTTPVDTSTPPTTSNAPGYNAELTSLNNSDIATQDKQDALTTETAKQTADREAKFNSTSKAIEDALKSRKGEANMTDTAYSETNSLGTSVDTTSKKLKEVNNKITAIDIRTNEQIKQLEKNPQGLFGGALQQEISKVQRQAFSDKADLYIEKMSAQGDYDSAKSIADRKVSVALEEDKMNLDTLQFQYENNKDLFTKSEQRQFELAQTDRKNAYDTKKEELQNISDLSIDALKNGAPALVASQMRNAKTVAEAMQIGGQYVGALDRQKARSSLYTDSLQQKKLLNELNPSSDGTSNDDLSAYASQYADTGKLPSPAELKLSGLNVGQVTTYAKQLPKPNGALVSTNTGTKSSALSPAEEQGITALSEIVRTTLPTLKTTFDKLNSGLLGRVGAVAYTTQDRQDYRTLRADFLAKLLVARSGGAVTEQEYQRYADLVPTEMGNALLGGVSNVGGKTLNSLSSSMKSTLDNKLNTQQLSIYGYSKIKVGGVDRTVGEILDVGGVKYKVLPDGTLTDII